MKTKPIALYFFERGCPDCDEVDRIWLPELRKIQPYYRIERLDVQRDETIKRLIDLENKLRFETTVLAPIIIIDDIVLVGLKQISEHFNSTEAELRVRE